MRLAIIVLLILVPVLTRAQEPDLFSILTGSTWESDKERTVHWLEEFRPTLASDERFTDQFGRLTIKYDTNTYTIRVNGFVFVEPYRALVSLERKLVLQVISPVTGEQDLRIIEFDEDFQSYSIYVRLALIGPEFREFFRILE